MVSCPVNLFPTSLLKLPAFSPCPLHSRSVGEARNRSWIDDQTVLQHLRVETDSQIIGKCYARSERGASKLNLGEANPIGLQQDSPSYLCFMSIHTQEG